MNRKQFIIAFSTIQAFFLIPNIFLFIWFVPIHLINQIAFNLMIIKGRDFENIQNGSRIIGIFLCMTIVYYGLWYLAVEFILRPQGFNSYYTALIQLVLFIIYVAVLSSLKKKYLQG